MKYSGSNLFGYAIFTFTLHLNARAESGVACRDHQGRSYESGYHYIPGPDICTFCLCDNGNPTGCKTFTCIFREENCKPFRRGDTCCEFICPDDMLSPMSNEKPDGSTDKMTDGVANYDIGLRSVASFVTAVLSLSLLFFLIHRLRQSKIQVCVAGRQSRQLAEDQRNLSGMGYLEREALSHGVPMDNIPCGASYPLWKPPGNYFPRGEAPPPYEEAVAVARAEQALLSMNPHALPQLNFSSSYLPSGNNHAAVSLVGSAQSTMNGPVTSPLRESSVVGAGASTSPQLMSSSGGRPASSPSAAYSASYHRQTSNLGEQSEAASSSSLTVGTSTTSFTIGTATYENLPAPLAISNLTNQQHSVATGMTTAPQSVSNSHSIISKVYRPHTTLPRQSGAFTISASLPNSSVNAHRTIPRTLTGRAGTRLREIVNDRSNEFLRLSASTVPSQSMTQQDGAIATNVLFDGNPTQPASLLTSASQTLTSTASANSALANSTLVLPSVSASSSSVSSLPTTTSTSLSSVTSTPAASSSTSSAMMAASMLKQPERQLDLKVEKPQNFRPCLNLANEINEDGSFESVACTCSMQALPTLHDDADDYRSECENCKSATGSRYYLDNEDELLVTSPHETMTLHRRPDETASSTTPQYYRTSLTLPISTRQRTRSTGVRENWFSTMPQSSTESSDEN